MAAMIDYTQFIADFPEFANTAYYPENGITFWLTIAYARLPSPVWAELLNIGAELLTAHNITLEYQNARATAGGAAPGQQVGPLSSKSVSKASAGYDTGAGALDKGGNYNLTNYGTRFLELARLVGAQGMTQVQGCLSYPGVVVAG